MDKSEILKRVAPCSLLCHTCSAYNHGVICETSKKLLKHLEGMREFYQVHIPDAVEGYDGFEGVLRMYCAGPCPGCRGAGDRACCIKGCYLPECTKAHKVDFCGECDAFPCEGVRAVFEDEVYAQWLEGGRRIRESGIEAFWEEQSETPHYGAYKKQG